MDIAPRSCVVSLPKPVTAHFCFVFKGVAFEIKTEDGFWPEEVRLSSEATRPCLFPKRRLGLFLWFPFASAFFYHLPS